MTRGAGVDPLGVSRDPIINRLYWRRFRLGYSQSEVARRVGCAPSVISTAERGVHMPRLDTLHAWAEVLEMKIGIVDAEHDFS